MREFEMSNSKTYAYFLIKNYLPSVIRKAQDYKKDN